MTTQGPGPLRIAVDAMGGENAPVETVRGAVKAARELGVKVLLVGDKPAIETILVSLDRTGLSIRIVEATQMLVDGEDPVLGVLQKPDSSIALATRLVRDGEADAVVSAGVLGATMVAAMQYLRTMPGIERPIAGGILLSLAPKTVVLDLGNNIGVQPYSYVDFAAAGCVYAQTFLGINDPSVGLLNTGKEADKGTDTTREAFALLKKSGLSFAGNVEGQDIISGRVNVLVTDGFTGDVLYKLTGALGRAVSKWLANEFKDKIDPVELKKSPRNSRTDQPLSSRRPRPLWGVNGVSTVAPPDSTAEQIMHTISQARQAVENGFVEKLRTALEKAHAAIGRQVVQ
jgi:glycerol-3-phosphate acyltransferase PlsX